MKFRKGLEEVFEFLSCLMVLRLLNDLNRFTLDFMLANYVRSLIVNVYLEMLQIINGQCDWLSAVALSREIKWN